MYAVIFSAVLAEPPGREYRELANELRTLAQAQYGCTGFVSFTDQQRELSVSWWQTEEQISRWHKEAAHRLAQHKARSRWYRSYRVQVLQVCRDYQWEHDAEDRR